MTSRRIPLLGLATLASGGAIAAGALAASTNFELFATSPEFVGNGPTAIAVADFDGDTDLDLAVGSDNSSDVTVLRNVGGGDFIPVPSSPELIAGPVNALVAADLDGDGDQDLAASYNGAGGQAGLVAVLRNGGTGNFGEAGTSPEQVGEFPFSMVVGDWNGDTIPDLAIANQFDDTVTVLRNTGTGNFVQAPTSPESVGTSPVAIAAADLEGDGDTDLATANATGANVTILRNTGTGNFTQPAFSPEPAGNGPRAIAAADFNGDLDPDLAVANQMDNTVTIMRNRGTGNMTPVRSSPRSLGGPPVAIATADFEDDGDRDLAVAVTGGSPHVAIFRNGGLANFNQPATSPEPTGISPTAIAAGDLDGDLDSDLAVTSFSLDQLWLFKNL